MNISLKQNGDVSYMVVAPGEEVIANDRDALDLVAICGEEQTYQVLLHSDNLSETFYDLKTGLAGLVLLKFSNYRLKVALVLPRKFPVSDRFAEFASETRTSREFRIFYTEESAVQWLTRNGHA